MIILTAFSLFGNTEASISNIAELEGPPVVRTPKPFITVGFINLIITTAITFALRGLAGGISKIISMPYNALGECVDTIKNIPGIGGILSTPFKVLQTIVGIPTKLIQGIAGAINIIFIVLVIILIITLILKIVSRIKYNKNKKAYTEYHKNLHNVVAKVVDNSKKMNSLLKKSLNKQAKLEKEIEDNKIEVQHNIGEQGGVKEQKNTNKTLDKMSFYG